MGIIQFTNTKWLTMKSHQKLIDISIYVDIVNLLQLTNQT